MLGITRLQVLAFLEEYSVSYRNDSSNDTDLFLRNRLRHHVLPLLREENPRLCENLSSMALRLRQDEEALQAYSKAEYPLSVSELLQKPAAVRIRILERFLKNAGVTEPEAEHLRLAEALVFSEKPSSRIVFPGNVLVYRQYDLLLYGALPQLPEAVRLTCPGTAYFGSYCITCEPAVNCENSSDVFTLSVDGELWVRSRLPGDAIKTPGGTKSLKKLLIDRKIPAIQRDLIPVLSDNNGVAAVLGFGSDLNHRMNSLPAWRITVHKKS
jgi:tRNA(Ile)-lysidine synthase